MKVSKRIRMLLPAIALLLFCAGMATGCEDKKKAKSETVRTEPIKDSVPPLDKDSNNTTRPENIKNGGAPPTP